MKNFFDLMFGLQARKCFVFTAAMAAMAYFLSARWGEVNFHLKQSFRKFKLHKISHNHRESQTKVDV